MPTFIQIIEIIFTILGGLGGLILVINFISDFFLKEIRIKRKLEKLVPGTNIDFFNKALGQATFINKFDNNKQYIFVGDYFYVEAMTDFDNKVLAYSVTTRAKDFSPTLVIGPYTTEEKIVNIRLGVSTFSDIDYLGGYEGKVTSGLGNRRAGYREEYYFGNPGLYQTYIFGMNDAGYIEMEHPEILNVGAVKSTDSRIQEFRKTSVINTYTVVGPFVNSDKLDIGMCVGPDLDQVRVIDKYN